MQTHMFSTAKVIPLHLALRFTYLPLFPPATVQTIRTNAYSTSSNLLPSNRCTGRTLRCSDLKASVWHGRPALGENCSHVEIVRPDAHLLFIASPVLATQRPSCAPDVMVARAHLIPRH